MRRTPLRRSTIRRDPVTPDVALDVLRRDAGCVAVTLGEVASDCRGRLQIDHVKDHPRMGKRAPSDRYHLVSLCEFHHLEGWATSHRPELRAYLRGDLRQAVYQTLADDCNHVEPVHGCEPCWYRSKVRA